MLRLPRWTARKSALSPSSFRAFTSAPDSSRTRTTSPCEFQHAWWRGVLPDESVTEVDPESAASTDTSPFRPLDVAMSMTVCPSLSATDGSAPFSSRSLAASTFPSEAIAMSGVLPWRSAALTSAPASRSLRMTSLFPLLETMCSGVVLSLEHAHASAPFSISMETRSRAPFWLA